MQCIYGGHVGFDVVLTTFFIAPPAPSIFQIFERGNGFMMGLPKFGFSFFKLKSWYILDK
jgi:hypothetical protein